MDTKPKNQITSASSRIPTYAERHGKFNRLVDGNPWVKIYVAVILLAEAAGCYFYATSRKVDMAELLDGFGLFGMLGAILLVFLPFIVLRLGEVLRGDES